VLGASAQESVDFYWLSLKTESGLLPAESLRPLWPNVQTVSTTLRAVVTLDQVLAAAWPANVGAPDWLWVDTWPSVAVLQGAERTLRTTQVLVVRVALPPVDQGALQACSYKAAHEWLARKGYVSVSVIESRHPMTGWALFVRDSAATLEQFQQQIHVLAKEKTNLIAEHDVLAQEKVQLLALRDTLTEEKTLLDAAKTQAEPQQQQPHRQWWQRQLADPTSGVMVPTRLDIAARDPVSSWTQHHASGHCPASGRGGQQHTGAGSLPSCCCLPLSPSLCHCLRLDLRWQHAGAGGGHCTGRGPETH
jgi:hypothetical protein